MPINIKILKYGVQPLGAYGYLGVHEDIRNEIVGTINGLPTCSLCLPTFSGNRERREVEFLPEVLKLCRIALNLLILSPPLQLLVCGMKFLCIYINRSVYEFRHCIHSVIVEMHDRD